MINNKLVHPWAGAFLFLCLIFVKVVPAAGSVTISGTISYDDYDYGKDGYVAMPKPRPARGVLVYILDASDNELANTKTGYGSTGYPSGEFNVTVASLGVGDTFKLRVVAENNAAKVGPTGVWPYTATRIFSANSTSVNATWNVDGATPNARASLNIIDAMTDGWFYAQEQSGKQASQVEVVFPHTGIGATQPFYSSELNNINIRDNGASRYEDGDDTLLHEYAHFIWDTFTFYLILPTGDHFGCENADSSSLAFSEGWAYYFAAATKNSAKLYLYPGVAASPWLDLENGYTYLSPNTPFCGPNTGLTYTNGEPYYPGGALWEGTVASILWDAKDNGSEIGSSNELFDGVFNEKRVFEIIDEDWTNDLQVSRYLVKDFGTSKSQNRLANATTYCAPDALRPCRFATPSQARRWLRSTPSNGWTAC